MKVESAGSADAKRIVDADGNILVMLTRYMNNKWRLHDRDTDRLMFPNFFDTPNAALKFFKDQGSPISE